jgi:hypothetical protein
MQAPIGAFRERIVGDLAILVQYLAGGWTSPPRAEDRRRGVGS